MPMHDWTRVDSGTYHDFHEDWIIELRRRLNAGILPKGYFARADQRVNGPEPDRVAYQLDPSPVGVAVADSPPKARLQGKVASEAARYARRANRITIRKGRGRVVAIVEFVSPGNKNSKKAIREFTSKPVRHRAARRELPRVLGLAPGRDARTSRLMTSVAGRSFPPAAPR